ncbi:single-stranded DNA-binding protein [Micrococcus sp.]|uniref:single-stranded DNA-binding protein n=1 Tax=Micrococcus sp. TaxID=1271 RepID=UPI002A916067|nr:single-stranded DNA-binding protein [Micrococcus sp.]MDY6054394.1 single-stranded DNA-binding protein [Micrococcus sp.]
MQDTLTLRGFVATDPATRQTSGGTEVTAFRMASTERRYDKSAGTWVDAHTNWYNVSAFGQLGANTAQSVRKGNPVIVTGRLRVRDWSTQERSGTSVDVLADSVGLDLGYGSAAFVRSQRSAPARLSEPGREAGPSRDEQEGEQGTQAEADVVDGFGLPLPPALRGGDAQAGTETADDDSPETERTDATED